MTKIFFARFIGLSILLIIYFMMYSYAHAFRSVPAMPSDTFSHPASDAIASITQHGSGSTVKINSSKIKRSPLGGSSSSANPSGQYILRRSNKFLELIRWAYDKK